MRGARFTISFVVAVALLGACREPDPRPSLWCDSPGFAVAADPSASALPDGSVFASTRLELNIGGPVDEDDCMVRLTLFSSGVPIGTYELMDGGKGGDAMAGDGLYSGTIADAAGVDTALFEPNCGCVIQGTWVAIQ